MPLLTVRTNALVDDIQVEPMLKACSAKLAVLLGKPESYVMTLFGRVAGMTMGGSAEPACLVEVRSVGKISSVQAREVSASLTGFLAAELGVPSGRIFLNFTEVPGAMWGYDGGTFG